MLQSVFGRKDDENRVRQEGRLPPGQALTNRFPVLHYGPVPRFNPATWNLRVFGEVEQEVTWNWQEFNQLPRTRIKMDIHCVTRWSKFDTEWEGVSLRTLVDEQIIKLKPNVNWIQQRMMGQETRNKLADYWKDHDIKKEEEYAILTNIIHQEWSDLTVKDHKDIKGLKTQNLHERMSEAELIFTALAELSTRQIAENMEATGMEENKVAGKKGVGITKKARLDLEEKTGKKVVSTDNYLPPQKSPKKLSGGRR